MDFSRNKTLSNYLSMVTSLIKNYQSLMPMAMEARKSIFRLLPADGAIGSHMDAVRYCRREFESLARQIARTCGIPLPSSAGHETA